MITRGVARASWSLCPARALRPLLQAKLALSRARVIHSVTRTRRPVCGPSRVVLVREGAPAVPWRARGLAPPGCAEAVRPRVDAGRHTSSVASAGGAAAAAGGAAVSGGLVSGERRGITALYAGSFDPPTTGHLDIIARARQLCHTLIVAVAVNPSKQSTFSSAERVELVTKMCAACHWSDQDVHVEAFDGLIVEFARARDVQYLVRGIRAYADFEYEMRLALMNRKLTGIETAFLMADERLSFVSSSLIRETAHFGRILPHCVPRSIEKEVFQRFGVDVAALGTDAVAGTPATEEL